MQRFPAILVAGLVIAAALAAGCRDQGKEPAGAKAGPKYMEELAAKRDHVTIVISGRLMGEIYPCG